MTEIAPLGYERYAVLVSPLLVSDFPTSAAGNVRSDLAPVAGIESTARQKQNTPDFRLSGQDAEVLDVDLRRSRRTSVPVIHPDPSTGRGQKIDIFA